MVSAVSLSGGDAEITVAAGGVSRPAARVGFPGKHGGLARRNEDREPGDQCDLRPR